MNDPSYYEKAPFLICAKDLLKALKEELIGELSFISTTAGLDDRKRKQCKKFFPFCSIELKSQGKSSPQKGDFSRSEPRWKWIKNNHPDFDVLIDDSPVIIKETKKEFGSEKLYVVMDYPIVEKVERENVYRVPISPLSDKEHKDFIQLAKDYREKLCNIDHKEIKKENNLLNMIGSGIIGFIFGVFFVWIFKLGRRNKKKHNKLYNEKK